MLEVIFFIAKKSSCQPGIVLAGGVTVPKNAGGSPTTGYFLLPARGKQPRKKAAATGRHPRPRQISAHVVDHDAGASAGLGRMGAFYQGRWTEFDHELKFGLSAASGCGSAEAALMASAEAMSGKHLRAGLGDDLDISNVRYSQVQARAHDPERIADQARPYDIGFILSRQPSPLAKRKCALQPIPTWAPASCHAPYH